MNHEGNNEISVDHVLITTWESCKTSHVKHVRPLCHRVIYTVAIRPDIEFNWICATWLSWRTLKLNNKRDKNTSASNVFHN